MLLGMVNKASRSSSHAIVLILKIKEREALVTSVIWSLPSVIFQISQESIVPHTSSPASARSLAPSTLSKIHFTLVAEK